MTSRHCFHSQLSSIMETMARSALTQVCKLVDEDMAELRLGFSQLLADNSALTDKLNSLESELTRSDAPDLCKGYRSVGVQTVCHKDGDAHASGSPTIEGVFGSDWCMDLWSRDLCSLEGDSPPTPRCAEESVGTLSNQMTVAGIKEEKGYVEDASSRCQQGTEEHKESWAEEPEPSLVGYSADGSTCSLSFEQDGEPVLCTDSIEELTMKMISINDTDEAFSPHIIPIEEEEEEEDEEEEDGVQFVEESQQESTTNAEGGSTDNTQQPLPSDDSENSTVLDKDALGDLNVFACKICGMTFFHKGTLTLHTKGHKSNFCNICKRQFAYRKKFNSHICTSPASPRMVGKSCKLCRKVFANPSALRIHYVVHTGEKPHRCSICGKRFTQKGNLKCHLRIHTGERPFCCVKCGKTFTQKVNLNHHLMAHRNAGRHRSKPVRP